MKDVLLLVDVISDFRRCDSDALLESFRARHGALVAAVEDARRRDVPLI